MPRPKNPDAPEPKKRSRTGCWTCKAKKIKCGEEKPRCLNCEKNGEKVCDYSIRLNWEGRSKRKANELTPEPQEGPRSGGGQMQMLSFQPPNSEPPRPIKTESQAGMLDPALALADMSTAAREFSTQFPRPQMFPGEGSRPSSAGSRRDSPTISPRPGSAGLPQGQMLPPFSGFIEHRDKRARPSPTSQPQLGTCSPDYLSPHVSQAYPISTPFPQPPKSNLSGPLSELNARSMAFPLTPSASSVTSDDTYPGTLHKATSPLPLAYNDPRRLSVNSLLTQEADAKAHGEYKDPKLDFTQYGIDRGLPDLDTPKNDDVGVIDVVTPTMTNFGFNNDSGDISTEFGFGLYHGSTELKKATGYPDGPISVNIPNSLNPLPDLLLSNKMNLMYFHFFLEFTARILVPHDCPENPFKIILPQMAVRDDNLLHLLLAYSASHRARLLGHPEPANRIAAWVQDVFPNLRHALDDSAGQISNANLATAIMLASLEIIAPNTFEVAVPWQDHLSMARSMIIKRGGPAVVNRTKDRVSYFLIRWFAYLDVLGNFSSTGLSADQAMFRSELYDLQEKNDFQIDCVLGFSGYLASVLARISDLARKCDAERITKSGDIDASWRPGPQVEAEAEAIKQDLHQTQLHGFVLCPHKQASEAETTIESGEMRATNDAFFWAGLLHLYRRVLGLSQDSREVQQAVASVVETLKTIRPGGSAEACILFPLFSAGCEALDLGSREILLERVKSVETSGMTQVHKARRLMELVWETGRPWETLVQGEFFG